VLNFADALLGEEKDFFFQSVLSLSNENSSSKSVLKRLLAG
jgi:hypothetical protein